MKKQIKFRGKVSLVEKNGNLYARATFQLKGKRKQIWRLITDEDVDDAAHRVVRAIENHLNPSKDESWVYLIHAQGTKLYKIGVAADPEARLRELQTANPLGLVLLYKIPGTRSVEQAIHRKLEEYRVRGEWFEFHSAIKPVDAFQSVTIKLGTQVVPNEVPTLSEGVH